MKSPRTLWSLLDVLYRWIYHCHILKYHDAGMTANFEVMDPKVEVMNLHNHRHHHHSKKNSSFICRF